MSSLTEMIVFSRPY